MFIGGPLASAGHANPLTLVVLAAVAGDSVGYRTGKALGPRMRRSRPGRWVGDAR